MSETEDNTEPRSAESTDAGRLLIPTHGGYRKLRSHRAALAVYDATVVFCDRFIERRSRTHDQMVQAARSGVRNIEEGSVASGTSKKSELKLTNVARASLEELMRDFEDFLRHRRLPVWEKDSTQAREMRARLAGGLSDGSDGSDASDASDASEIVRKASAEIAANCALCLIHQASYLLRRQMMRLEQDFLEHGGFTERMYKCRTRQRWEKPERSDSSDKSDGSDKPVQADAPPACPACGKPMRLRTARRGARLGERFWGCSGYPGCCGTREVEPNA